MPRILLILSLCFLIGCNSERVDTHTGTITHTAKAKDIASLCYSYSFTAEKTGKTFGIVAGKDTISFDDVQGKTVTISGRLISKPRAKSNPMEQTPVSIDGKPMLIQCEYFQVSKIKR